MIFVFKAWEKFCSQLDKEGLHSIPACAVTAGKRSYLVLKHDVETNVPCAYKMASIEHTYGHCGSYYVQAYLLDDPKNVELLTDMQKMGHEISYHYDVMDSSKGDMEKALAEFIKNKELFEKTGLFFTRSASTETQLWSESDIPQIATFFAAKPFALCIRTLRISW